jgi:hypothetical protein
MKANYKKYKRKAKAVVNRQKRSFKNNPKQYSKNLIWIIVLGVILLAGKKILKWVNGIGSGVSEYGLDPEASGYDMNLLVGDSGGELAGDSGGQVIVRGKVISHDIVTLIDLINVKLQGYNAFAYPEIINRLANLSKGQLWNAIIYHKDKYGSGLYDMINSETTGNNWIDGYLYAPALNKIKKYGWHGQ